MLTAQEKLYENNKFGFQSGLFILHQQSDTCSSRQFISFAEFHHLDRKTDCITKYHVFQNEIPDTRLKYPAD